jgi:hypothetical protein
MRTRSRRQLETIRTKKAEPGDKRYPTETRTSQKDRQSSPSTHKMSNQTSPEHEDPSFVSTKLRTYHGERSEGLLTGLDGLA